MCYVEITKVVDSVNWCYFACDACMSKVFMIDDNFKCENCDMNCIISS